MKKIYCLILCIAVCFSMSGCSFIQASIAEEMEAAMGEEGKSFEEHQEFYQSDWDELFDSIDYLLSLTDDSEEDADEENESTEDEEEASIDWENITEDDKLTIANIKDENGYTEYYNNKFSKGQCTWYAYGRMKEKMDIDLDVYGPAKKWLDNCANSDNVSVETNPAGIQENSVAVFRKPSDTSHAGHVVYVEHVTYDENGNPDKVYFTECNLDPQGPKWGVYNEGDDCIVKAEEYSYFINRCNGNHELVGYLIPKK